MNGPVYVVKKTVYTVVICFFEIAKDVVIGGAVGAIHDE